MNCRRKENCYGDHQDVGEVEQASLVSATTEGMGMGGSIVFYCCLTDHIYLEVATELRKGTGWKKVYVSPNLTLKKRKVNKALREELR